MRGPNGREHHHPSRLGPAFVRRASAAVAAAAFALLPLAARATGASPVVTVKLPTEADAVAVGAGIEGILNGPRGIETRIPGPATDREEVRVSFGLDGAPVAVVDEQRLVLSGLGDFEFKLPGPASDVQALPGSASEPGLRRGAVLWQGFSSGRKALGATVTLLPEQEATRLPVRVRLSMTVDGRPVTPGRATSGALLIRLLVENTSAVPIQVIDGGMDPAAAAPVLDAIRDDLRHGERPTPGTSGIPASVSVEEPVTVRTAQLEAPMRVSGSIALPSRAATVTVVDHGRTVTGDGGWPEIEFGALLGGGEPLRLVVELRAEVRGLRLPRVGMTVEPAPPAAGFLRPPAGQTWVDGLRRDPGAFDGRKMLRLVLDTMWRTARLRQFDAYLGNPDSLGPSRTTYRFVLAPPSSAAEALPEVPAGGPLRTAAAIAVVVAVVLGGLVAWSRS